MVSLNSLAFPNFDSGENKTQFSKTRTHDVTCGSVSLFIVFVPFSRRLPQKVVAQQQEMERLALKKTTVDDQSALMKELTALRQQTLNNSQELKVGGTNMRWAPEDGWIDGRGPQRWKALFSVYHETRRSPEPLTTGIRITENG